MIISHSKGRGKKIHLLLDDEYQITTDIDFWSENYIKDGTEIDDEQWQELVDKINFKKAVNKCYDFLSRRDYSVKELKDKLLRTVDLDNAQRAIDLMLDYGYLNDEEYAKELLNHLLNNKNMSKSFIIQEMRKKGISSDIYDELILNNEIDNISTAETLIKNKYIYKLNEQNGREKVIAALLRKGFSYSDILAALDKLEDYE